MGDESQQEEASDVAPDSSDAPPPPPQTNDGSLPRPRITAAGLALLWGSVGIELIGLIRFDGALILLGFIGLTMLGVTRFWAPRNLAGIQVARELPSQVFSGEAFEIGFTLATGPNRRIDAFGVSIRDELLTKGERNWLRAERIPARGGYASGRLRARLFRRGIERRQRYEMKSGFPLGLFEVSREGSVAIEEERGLIVFPRPLLPDELRRELDLARFEIAHPSGIEPEPGGDFRGVRTWRPGDSPRAIHWPATARIGSMQQDSDDPVFTTLMVREWDPPGPRPQRFGILFHSLAPAGNLIRPDRFESALRIVAGLLLYCRDAGIPARFESPFPGLNGREPGPLNLPDGDSFQEALTRLAVAKRIACPSAGVITAALGRFVDCERVFIVSDTPVKSWKQAAGGFPQPVVCIDSEAMKIERPRLRLRTPRRRASA